TLASSDYGYLDHKDFSPRPNYWIAHIWNQLMGDDVYENGIAIEEGMHAYTHSRKDGKKGFVYGIMNNSQNKTNTVEVPAGSVLYSLSASSLRSKELLLNGKAINLVNDQLPKLVGVEVSGKVEIKPLTINFIVVQ
ncbi:MAG: beta-glucuronidase, partial [Anaeroplasmataceae bacterium]